MMGGTPTNIHGQAFTSENEIDNEVPAFSVGEAACVSVHGANSWVVTHY